MCWVGKKTGKRVATEDIRVLKVLERDECPDEGGIYHSPYQEMVYTLGSRYKTEIEERRNAFDNSDEIEIAIGFHSYDINVIGIHNTCGWLAICNGWNQFAYCFYARHSIKSSVHNFEPIPMISVCCEFIIPKGATYYENEFGEVVSEEIIFNKVICEVGEDGYIDTVCRAFGIKNQNFGVDVMCMPPKIVFNF